MVRIFISWSRDFLNWPAKVEGCLPESADCRQKHRACGRAGRSAWDTAHPQHSGLWPRAHRWAMLLSLIHSFMRPSQAPQVLTEGRHPLDPRDPEAGKACYSILPGGGDPQMGTQGDAQVRRGRRNCQLHFLPHPPTLPL